MSSQARILKKLIQSKIFSQVLAVATGKSHTQVDQFTKRLFSSRHTDHLGIAIAALGSQKRLNIIQVGANDGITGDPIYKDVIKYAQKALLIEPQEWLIGDLKKAYQDFAGELVIDNIAIGSRGGG